MTYVNQRGSFECSYSNLHRLFCLLFRAVRLGNTLVLARYLSFDLLWTAPHSLLWMVAFLGSSSALLLLSKAFLIVSLRSTESHNIK